MNTKTNKAVVGADPELANVIQSLWGHAEAHLKALTLSSLPVPDSDQPVKPDDYGGKILYRTSKSTHRALNERAQREGVSVNALINEAVHRFLGF